MEAFYWIKYLVYIPNEGMCVYMCENCKTGIACEERNLEEAAVSLRIGCDLWELLSLTVSTVGKAAVSRQVDFGVISQTKEQK